MHAGAAAEALALVDALTREEGCAPECVELLRYATDEAPWAARAGLRPLPAASHAAMLARVGRALEARGQPVRIVEYAG